MADLWQTSRFDEIMPTTLSPKTKPEPASDAGIMMEQKLKMSEENSIIPIDLPKFEKKKSHPVFKLKRQGSLRIVAGNSVDAVEYVVDSSRESQTRANIIDLLAGGKLGSTPSQSTGGAKKKQGKLVKILKIPKM